MVHVFSGLRYFPGEWRIEHRPLLALSREKPSRTREMLGKMCAILNDVLMSVMQYAILLMLTTQTSLLQSTVAYSMNKAIRRYIISVNLKKLTRNYLIT